MTGLSQSPDLSEAPAGVGLFSREEILQAERWAWAGTVSGGKAEFFYDGINFWRRGASGDFHAASFETPASGWWHRTRCNCRLCEPRASRPREGQTTAEVP